MTRAGMVSYNPYSITFLINDARYTYFVSEYFIRKALQINKKSGLKALNYIKDRAYETCKENPVQLNNALTITG